MSILEDSQQAVNVLHNIQQKLGSASDSDHQNDLNTLIHMLESPLFRQLLTIEDSLHQIKQINKVTQLKPDDVDISAEGKLSINPDFKSLSKLNFHPNSDSTFISSHESEKQSYSAEFLKEIEHIAADREYEMISLYKLENYSLGFSVVGLRSEHQGEIGIFIQQLQPGGIASNDGRLKENDQILAIDGQILQSNISHAQAIALLQAARGRVRLVLARGPHKLQPVQPSHQSPAKQEQQQQQHLTHQQHTQQQPLHSITNATNERSVAQDTRDALPGLDSSPEAFTESESEVLTHAAVSGSLSKLEPASLDNNTTVSTSAEQAVSPERHDDSDDMVLNSEWTQLEVIDLINDGTGLGFGIIGGKSTGVVVKTILPAGVADRLIQISLQSSFVYYNLTFKS